MKRVFLPSASLALCWTLSPDALVYLGNSFGRHGETFGLALLAGAVLSAAAASILHHTPSSHHGNGRRETLGGKNITFLAVSLAGRLSPALLLSTGMLVTAGFTFNETFAYRFPNFAFSFLLLLLVLVLHLSGERAVLAAQQVFFILTSFGLLFLGLAGLMAGGPESPQPAEAAPAGFGAFLTLVPLAMLLFAGYDQQLESDERSHRHFPATVGLGLLLLTLWGLASLSHVPPARLAESSVPYVVGAKAILGQPGRLIMGIAIISGTCGAVNGLFYLAVRTIGQLVPHEVAPIAPKRHFRLARIQASLMALVIGLFMAFGLAGSERLEVYIFGALLLWLLAIGVDCLAAGMRLHRQRRGHSFLGYIVGGLILAAVAYLAFTYPQLRLLVGFCLPVLAAGALFSAIWSRYGAVINNSQGGSL